MLQAQPAHPFVSRGGVKLAGALEHYPIDIEDHVCLDVGASTGGFTEVLLANGASLVFSIDVGREQLHPSLHGHPRIVSMEETDIRDFEGKRLPRAAGRRRHRRQFHFAESRAAGGAVAGGGADALLALIKPQFEAARKHSKRGIIRDAMVHQEICDDIAAFVASLGCTRHRGVSVIDHGRRRQYRILHRRAPWLNASSSITSAIAATASLSLTDNLFVPYTLGGETVEVEAVAGHPDRRHLLRSSMPARNGSHRSASILASAAAARSSTGETERYRAWKRNLVVEMLAHASMTARCIR